MANDYFNDDGNPGYRASLASSPIRTLFAAVKSAFDKLPTLTANGGKTVKVNSAGTALELSKVTITEPATSATLTIINGKTATVSNTLTLAGTDGTTMTFPGTSGAVVTEDSTSTLTNKTMVAPALGTPASVVLTNATGLPTAGLVDDAVTYAKIQNVSATDKILGRSTAGAGNVEEIACTSAGRNLLDDANAAAQRVTLGLEIGVNVQAYDADLTTWAGVTPGTGVATFLATPSSANLAAAVTGETGTGALVFATSPALVTPNLGTPSACTLTNATGLPAAGVSGTALVAAAIGTTVQAYDADLAAIAGLTSAADKGIQFTGSGTAATFDLTAAAKTVLDDATVAAMVNTLGGATSTGSGGLVRATSATLVTPALGTPASGVLTNCTFPTLNQNTTGTAANATQWNTHTIKIGSAVYDAPSINGNTGTSFTITVTGAQIGDHVMVSPPNIGASGLTVFNITGVVTSADTVTVYIFNTHASNAYDLASGTWLAIVIN